MVIDGKNRVDGQGMGVTGILLENVCKCMVRNVTIRNCEVGIHIRNARLGVWSEGNCLKHIRMENVKIGILFTTTGPLTNLQDVPFVARPGDSAAFTTIDDVDICLVDTAGDAVGIQVGGTRIYNGVDNNYQNNLKYDDDDDDDTTRIAPYSSRIRAHVRLGNSGGAGLKLINGPLWYGQSQLTVHNNHNSPNGEGINLENFKGTVAGDPKPIWRNQFSTFTGIPPNDVVTKKGFMLVTSKIDPAKRIVHPSGSTLLVDVETKTL